MRELGRQSAEGVPITKQVTGQDESDRVGGPSLVTRPDRRTSHMSLLQVSPRVEGSCVGPLVGHPRLFLDLRRRVGNHRVLPAPPLW